MNNIIIPTQKQGIVSGTCNGSGVLIDFLRTSRGHYDNKPFKRGLVRIPTQSTFLQLQNLPLMSDKQNNNTILIPFEWTLGLFLDFDVFNEQIICSRMDTCMSFDCSKIEQRSNPVFPIFASEAEMALWSSGEYKLQYTPVDFNKEVFVYAKT